MPVAIEILYWLVPHLETCVSLRDSMKTWLFTVIWFWRSWLSRKKKKLQNWSNNHFLNSCFLDGWWAELNLVVLTTWARCGWPWLGSLLIRWWVASDGFAKVFCFCLSSRRLSTVVVVWMVDHLDSKSKEQAWKAFSSPSSPSKMLLPLCFCF